MILVGSQRGGNRDLAQHLLKDDNERVVVHDIRGFASDDLHSAFQESYAISRGTKCKQHLFSLSLNPPQEAEVSEADFEDAISRVEQSLGLTDQPRAIVFHEKQGADGQTRRHAHAVWCRIDVQNMKAIQLSFSHSKLQAVARDLYREHRWQMPRGFVRHEERDPRNFTLAEWQQCKRADRDPAKTKAIFQDVWAISDSRSAFAHALEAHGLILAKGDRRGHIAVDHNGEAYAVSRYTGLKARQVRDRLGSPDDLPDKAKAHEIAAQRVKTRLEELRAQEEQRAVERLTHLQAEQDRRREAHRIAASALQQEQANERAAQLAEQEARFRKGMLGFLDRFTGRKKRTEAQNREETAALKQSHVERQHTQQTHSDSENQHIQDKRAYVAARRKTVTTELTNDVKRLDQSVKSSRDDTREAFKGKRQSARTRVGLARNRDGPRSDR